MLFQAEGRIEHGFGGEQWNVKRSRASVALGKEGEELPAISIIVSTRNRPSYLKDLLRSLSRQYCGDFEVIVLDDYSDKDQWQKTTGIVEALKTQMEIDLIRNNRQLGIAASLNRGVRFSKGDILVFTDDDCITDENWLVGLVKHYVNPRIGGVGGRVIPAENDVFRPLSSRSSFKIGRIYPDGRITSNFDLKRDHVVAVDHLSGANMSFRRDIFQKVGGFDIAYTGNAYRFETDFALRVRKLGYELFFDSHAVVHHRRAGAGGNRISPERWYYWYARNNVYFLLQHFVVDDGPKREISALLSFVSSHMRNVLARKNIHPYAEPRSWGAVLAKSFEGILDGLAEYLSAPENPPIR